MADAEAPKPAAEEPKPATQLEFARIMSISQPAVHKLVRKGVLKTGHTLGQWLVSYGKHMAEVAAQWSSSDGIDRVREAALLDRVRREQIEIDLAKQRRELWPKATIFAAWEAKNATIRTKLLGLPNRQRSNDPQMSPKSMEISEQTVREILTELSNEQLPASLDAITAEYFSNLRAAAETNGERVGRSIPRTKPRKQRGAG